MHLSSVEYTSNNALLDNSNSRMSVFRQVGLTVRYNKSFAEEIYIPERGCASAEGCMTWEETSIRSVDLPLLEPNEAFLLYLILY